jgi:hypothetical protein
MRRTLRFLFLVTAVTVLVEATPGRAESKANPQVAPLNGPRSEFTFRPGFTKDPFFPKSTETVAAVAQISAIQQQTTRAGTVPDFVVLKGVSLTNGRKLAIINDQTVGENEVFTLKRGVAKPLQVRCVEIKPQSVVVGVDGATKELFLRLP